MVGGRGEIREVYFTDEERGLLEHALHDGRVVIEASCRERLRVAESLWQRGYLTPVGGHDPQTGEEFLPTGAVEEALKTAYRPK